jgi:hypothetical protein
MSNIYLIVTPNNLFPGLSKLISQKKSRGYEIKTLYIESLGKDPNKIRQKVLEIQPKCLLLVGDFDTTPGFPLNDGTENFSSDAYYSISSDNIIVPQIPTGRLSSNKLEEIKSICDKLVSYPADTDLWWRRRTILTGWIPRGPEHLGTPGGDEDAGWQCLREIGAYYDIIMEFEYDKDNEFCTPQSIDKWGVLDSSKASLISAIEKGAVIIRYNGHGSNDSWSNIGIKNQNIDESFGINDIKKLNVGNKLPLVISASCLTGQISKNPSFAEAWQIYGKAIGIFASDVISATFWDDRFTQAFYDAVITNQDRRVGDALINAMKLLIVRYPNADKNTFRKFRYLGDPDTILVAPEDDGLIDCRRLFLEFDNLSGDKKITKQVEINFPRKVRRVYPVLNGFNIEYKDGEHQIKRTKVNLSSKAYDIKIENNTVEISVELSLVDNTNNRPYKGFVDSMVFALIDPKDYEF